MALIEFKDYPDTTTPTNAENLNNNFNELSDNIDNLTQVELYSNSSGNSGNITLSDNITNYKYIEIFYKNNGTRHKSAKFQAIENVSFCLTIDYFVGTDFVNMNRIVTIAGKELTTSSYSYVTLRDNTLPIISATNYIYITKVIGYKS